MSKKRVVITGMGTVSGIGNSLAEFSEGIKTGRSGIDRITSFDVSEYSTQIGSEVKNLDISHCFDKKEIRRTSQFIVFAVVSAIEAVKHSGLDIEKEADRIGVEIGSGIGGVEVFEEGSLVLQKNGPGRMNPFMVPMMISDMAAGQVSIKTGARGPNACTVTACASATHSIGNAMRWIQQGDVVAMIAGGSEAAITPLGLGGFCAARSLSKNNDNPQQASRPFDANRDGFVMGNGAGSLILEEREHALARGAKIYAEIVGFGSSGDAYHITAPAPEGEGAQRAMEMALRSANISTSEIDYINAHGTSTALNDKNETAAIKRVFGDLAKNIKISSTKSMTGHLLGAAGAIEAIVCALALDEGFVPPTINYETPDPECDLDYTPNKLVKADLRYAMSNSFGFGGHNAVLIFKKAD